MEAWKHQIGKTRKMPVLQLKEFPPSKEGEPYAQGLTMRFLTGALEGTTIPIIWAGYDFVTGEADAFGWDIAVLLKQAKVGDKVAVNNSDYIAVQTYHRHQVPGPEFHTLDFFRDENGKSQYPQRLFLVAPSSQRVAPEAYRRVRQTAR